MENLESIEKYNLHRLNFYRNKKSTEWSRRMINHHTKQLEKLDQRSANASKNETDVDLKPCPFCGGNATQPEKESPTGRPIWRIGCAIYCFNMRRTTKKSIIEDWNERV